MHRLLQRRRDWFLSADRSPSLAFSRRSVARHRRSTTPLRSHHATAHRPARTALHRIASPRIPSPRLASHRRASHSTLSGALSRLLGSARLKTQLGTGTDRVKAKAKALRFCPFASLLLLAFSFSCLRRLRCLLIPSPPSSHTWHSLLRLFFFSFSSRTSLCLYCPSLPSSLLGSPSSRKPTLVHRSLQSEQPLPPKRLLLH